MQEGYPTSNLTAAWVIRSVVLKTSVPRKGLVAALWWGLDGMTQANGATGLELPIVQIQKRLFRWCPKAKAIANTTTGQKSGLFAQFNV